MSSPSERVSTPSDWVRRWVPAASADERALDLACGAGRHARELLRRGYTVTAVDFDLSRVRDLFDDPRVETWEADLENGGAFPLAGRTFGVVVVTNYLHRPLLPLLVDAVAAGGRLLYETFSVDQPRFGRPTNPGWLLRPGELLEVVGDRLRVRGYEDCVVDDPPRAVQRICAERALSEAHTIGEDR